MNDPVIQTSSLTKYFGPRCAVDRVSLSVPRGQVVALLGRNGSGKTTLIRMLLGLIPPTRGSAHLLSDDSQNLSPTTRARVGYVAETHPLHDHMTVREIGSYQSRFYETWDEDTFRSITSHFRLPDSGKISSLSRGQRAGVSLAITLAPAPDLLLLDDPALGLDPVARRLLLESMLHFTRDRDRTILFSSHILADVERVADRIAVLDRAVLRVDAPVDSFRNRVRQFLLTFPAAPPSTLPPLPGLLNVRRDENELRLTLANPTDDTLSLLSPLKPTRISEVPTSLEDAVIGYLGARDESSTFTTERGAA